MLIVGFAVLDPAQTEQIFKKAQALIVAHLSWYYVLIVAIIVFSVVVVSFSKYGDIKLGPDHAEPDYSYLSWFAMLFSAGMGIGLMFFGVAEPVMHFLSPPVGNPDTVAAAREAMTLTFFHWGLHAWSIYAIVALILAYFSFRHNLPLTLRSALFPIIGEKIYGPGAMRLISLPLSAPYVVWQLHWALGYYKLTLVFITCLGSRWIPRYRSC
nr:BCCT family transporter [Dongshaea marina]